VGKTSLMNRYAAGTFTGRYKATIGADFLSKSVTVTDPATGLDRHCTLQIWDTAGQERFQSLGTAFYRGADACLLVYDVTDPASLDHLDGWREEFLRHVGGGNGGAGGGGAIGEGGEGGGGGGGGGPFPFVVLGNKMDRVEAKPESRAVPRERAEEFCSRAGPWLEGGEDLPHYETSAKTDANVEAAFLEAAALALLHEERRRKESPQLFVPPTTVDLSRREKKEGRRCC